MCILSDRNELKCNSWPYAHTSHYWKLKISYRYQRHRQKNYNYPVGMLKPTEKLPHRQKYVKLPVGTHVTDRKITYTQEKKCFFSVGCVFPCRYFFLTHRKITSQKSRARKFAASASMWRQTKIQDPALSTKGKAKRPKPKPSRM
jgi:hypothetical protein